MARWTLVVLQLGRRRDRRGENAVPERIAAEVDLMVRKVSGPGGGH
jgi:hypothetical protein